MRTKPAPGLTPCAWRARKLPGRTMTFCSAARARAKRASSPPRNARPQIEARVGHGGAQYPVEQRRHRGELGAVEVAVGHDMRFVVPGGDARRLHRRAHRVAMIGTVEQEGLEDRLVAGDEARAQPRNVGTFGQAREHHQPLETSAEQPRRLHAAERWIRLVEVDLE